MFPQNFPEPLAAFGFFPGVQIFPQRFSGHRQSVRVQQVQFPQMQHHLRHAAREEDAHGGMMNRAVGQHADQPRHAAIHGNPILNRRPFQSGGMGDGGNVQQQVG